MYPFYVYELIDPRDGAVFYVGKGKRDRIDAHEGEAFRGITSNKCDRIREIWAAGKRVDKREVARFMLAVDALAYEAERMSWYVNLTNVVGRGVRGRSRSKWLSPEAMRIVAWWFRESDGGKNQTPPQYPGQPWRTALAKAFFKRGHEFLDRIFAEAPAAEIAKRLKPWGIELVLPNGR